MDNSGTATLIDCTISGNSGFSGGGVYNSGTATLTHCTISGNYAFQFGGGVDNDGKATLTDTIVAGNIGPSSAASDIDGTVTGSHDLIGTGGSGGLINGQGGNIVLTSLAGLGLAPLAFYGGPTQTMALLAGSAAIGQGTAVSGVTTDQRGFSLDSPIDIGAFQFYSSDSLVVKSTSDGGRRPGSSISAAAVNLADVLTGARTITFDSTVFATAQTIVLTAGPLELSQTSGLETITGPQAGVTISGGGTSGVIQVNAGATASFSGLTITDGSNTSGAGMDNDGTVNLTNCTISGNSASHGGAVYNGGTGTATLTNCTLSGNYANDGGGVDNDGTATLINCTISGNSAFQYGGGVNNLRHGDSHQLHHQRKLRHFRRRGGQLWHGDAHQLHHQRKLRNYRRRGVQRRGLPFPPHWHGDAHQLHYQRKLRRFRAAGWATSARGRRRSPTALSAATPQVTVPAAGCTTRRTTVSATLTDTIVAGNTERASGGQRHQVRHCHGEL